LNPITNLVERLCNINKEYCFYRKSIALIFKLFFNVFNNTYSFKTSIQDVSSATFNSRSVIITSFIDSSFFAHCLLQPRLQVGKLCRWLS